MTLGRIIKMDLIMKMHAFKVGVHGKVMLIILIWHHVDDNVVGKKKGVDDEVCMIARPGRRQ